MPRISYPEMWKSKPLQLVFPSRIREAVMCHNCLRWTGSNNINTCTGLCPECIKENPSPIALPLLPPPTGRTSARVCKKCRKDISSTNFGIFREICEACMVVLPLKQRCTCCKMYNENCWNHICADCRSAGILCEKVGWIFRAGKEHHDRVCWCLREEPSTD